MQKDSQTAVAQSDSLICKFGSEFRFSHHTTKQVSYCASKMRSLAQLFITKKTLKPTIGDFRECLYPKNFDVLVESVRRMSKFDPITGETIASSVPPRLCNSPKRCASILKSEAIKSEGSRQEKTEVLCELNDFLHLMQKDWATAVGTISEKSSRLKKVTKADLLPDPDDIRTFGCYIHELCPQYMRDLQQVPTIKKNYDRLAKLTIAHIITLNRRRPNETVEIIIEAYRSTLDERTDFGLDVQNVLTEEEMESARQMVIFYAAANKKLKKVPVLLTTVFHEAVDTLLDSHEKIGIKSKYVFGRVGSVRFYDGFVILKELTMKAGLKIPSTFTPNALRDHATTSSQLQTRNDLYAKRLSKYMGHDLKTHEHFYEMPLPLVQKAIVGHKLQHTWSRDTTTRTMSENTSRCTTNHPRPEKTSNSDNREDSTLG
ncbi:uncharacterized protein LOC124371126 [Homalodisca vitripennis]|uniref:uncharacterized protein LOC124371126 n=1 Tax=Homalodisca vitripennis TaxID=197043 RepID=UPI001EEC7F8A|nr:uncharacterized protein LOC124371126 [Homalodisca vitripennis]